MYGFGGFWRSGWHQGPCNGAAGKRQPLQGYAHLQLPHTKQNVGEHNGLSRPNITV